ncbi:hypothetical protein [Prochlorococcus marinus]|uniref:hypothetical protein n=1 Tax=Prochlorococcus marinus TaxID=1219 RepID=UPI0039AED029
MAKKTRQREFLIRLLNSDPNQKLKNNPSIEEIVSVTLSCTLIRMTEINRIDRSVLYQEFKEWIVNSGESEESQEILCLRYLKNDRETN